MMHPIHLIASLTACIGITQGGAGTVQSWVESALAQGPRIRIARAERGISDAAAERDRPSSRTQFKATGTAFGNGNVIRIPGATSGQSAVNPPLFGQLEFALEQPLWNAGAGAARDLYAARKEAARLELFTIEADIALEVKRAALDLVEARAMVDLARKGLDLAVAQRKQVALMLSEGFASQRDLKSAEASEAEAQQGVIAAENGVELASRELTRQAGRPSISSAEVQLDLLSALPVSSMDGAIQRALASRSEIKALEFARMAAEAAVSLAGAQMQPELAMRAAASRQSPTALLAATTYGAGLSVTWNILDAGKARSDRRDAKANLNKIDAQIHVLREGIPVEVTKAWRDIETARAKQASAKSQVDAAESALSVSRARYEERTALLLEVQASTNDLQRARANLLRAELDERRARAALDRAMGSPTR